MKVKKKSYCTSRYEYYYTSFSVKLNEVGILNFECSKQLNFYLDDYINSKICIIVTNRWLSMNLVGAPPPKKKKFIIWAQKKWVIHNLFGDINSQQVSDLMQRINNVYDQKNGVVILRLAYYSDSIGQRLNY